MLDGAPRSPTSFNAQVSEIAAYNERNHYDWKMHEGQVARLCLEVVGVPGVGTRAPGEKHKKAYG